MIIDGVVKSSNSRHANFVIMRRTDWSLNHCEMQHNADVGISTKPSLYHKLLFFLGGDTDGG